VEAALCELDGYTILKLHPFSVREGDRFVAMGKVFITLSMILNYAYTLYRSNIRSKFQLASVAQDYCGVMWQNISCTLYLYGCFNGVKVLGKPTLTLLL